MSGILRRAVLWSVLTIGIVTAVGSHGSGPRRRRGWQYACTGTGSSGTGHNGPDRFSRRGRQRRWYWRIAADAMTSTMVKNAKHDAAGWKETVNHMVTYGAGYHRRSGADGCRISRQGFPGTDDASGGHASCNDTASHSSRTGGPDSAKDSAKTEDPDVAGERILNTACTTCHDLGPMTRRADDKASWEGIVYGMVGNGADVKDADIPILVDYLVKTYGPPKDAPKAPAAPAAPAGRGGRGARGQ